MVDALVRSVRFVKGGVSMGTLPEAPYPEVCFIGRSNVGKSSLTNFLVGRRAIAYTSKTPGKTQQYNYFVLNELAEGVASSSAAASSARMTTTTAVSASAGQPIGRRRAPSISSTCRASATPRCPEPPRKKWLQFLGRYCREREQPKMVVHLIDGEIGPLETDLMIMRMVRDAAKGRRGGYHASRRTASRRKPCTIRQRRWRGQRRPSRQPVVTRQQRRRLPAAARAAGSMRSSSQRSTRAGAGGEEGGGKGARGHRGDGLPAAARRRRHKREQKGGRAAAWRLMREARVGQ